MDLYLHSPSMRDSPLQRLTFHVPPTYLCQLPVCSEFCDFLRNCQCGGFSIFNREPKLLFTLLKLPNFEVRIASAMIPYKKGGT